MSTPARQLPAPDRRRRGTAADAPLRVTVPERKPDPRASEAPALRVVPRRVRRRRTGVVLALGLGTLFVLMVGLVAFQARIAQDQLRLDRMEREAQEAEATFARLRLQVAELEAPDRIVAEAQEQLGMVRPSPEQITYLAAPTVVATEVMASGGPDRPTGPSGSGDADEWSELKPVLSDG